MSRELLQQALDALKYHTEHTYPFHLTNVAIEALQKELAQPEQEPFKPDWANYRQGLADGAAQPEQEPVAWMYKGNFHDFDPSEWASPEFAVTPLYTAPPRKEWVDLTADGFKELLKMTVQGIDKNKLTEPEGIWLFGSLVQAKLKELNNAHT
jgi:hypothetical protein